MIASTLDFILDLIYPPKCVSCGELIDFRSKKIFCDKCQSSIKFIDGLRCVGCSRPIESGNYCVFCSSKKHWFNKNYSLFEYDEFIADLIHRFKFKNHPSIGIGLGKIMGKYIPEDFLSIKIDYVVPVPIHKHRMTKRGFNQSEILAREISKKIYLPLKTDIINRVVDTKPQWELDPKERENNLDNAFKCKKICDKNILLVDDIFTTGSTIDECAKTLKSSGAKTVFSFTVAVTSKRQNLCEDKL